MVISLIGKNWFMHLKLPPLNIIGHCLSSLFHMAVDCVFQVLALTPSTNLHLKILSANNQIKKPIELY